MTEQQRRIIEQVRDDSSKWDLSTIEGKENLLEMLDFVKLPGGEVRIGTDKALVCRLEKRRWNETPVREFAVRPFWICEVKVTNVLFELLNQGHLRCSQSPDNETPVVEVMYGEILTFCRKLNWITGMDFRLPTELEWIYAAAPFGWEFPYQEQAENLDVTKAHTYGDAQEHSTVHVRDERWEPNHFGLHQIGHNVSELTNGHYRTGSGAFGAQDDGMYTIAKGGNYGHCSFSAAVQRRILVDVSDRNTRIGFRLAHDAINSPENPQGGSTNEC